MCQPPVCGSYGAIKSYELLWKNSLEDEVGLNWLIGVAWSASFPDMGLNIPFKSMVEGIV